MRKINLFTLLFALSITGCSANLVPPNSENKESTSSSESPQKSSEAVDLIQIGILQPVEHDALKAAKDGFISRLAELGYVEGENININYKNANGVAADQTTLAKSLVSKSDLLLGIGTGASVDLKSAATNAGKDTPILFTAVTDAVGASLVASNENPGGNVTGTSDANPVEAQIGVIQELIPDVDKIGVFYTQSEINSEVQKNQAVAAATKAGITVEVATCTDSSDLVQNLTTLCGKDGIDAIYLPTDNNIAANMSSVNSVINKATTKILLVCGEENMVKSGGHITLSISYTELGKRTAEMAYDILKNGKKPSELPVVTMTKEECVLICSKKNIQSTGLTLSDQVLSKYIDISN